MEWASKYFEIFQTIFDKESEAQRKRGQPLNKE